MCVDQTSLDRIRNATFPTSRRGYDKQEVEKFLARLADWLETGAGDESRSDTVKRELERVGERTGAILAQAEESAQQIRGEAESLAREAIDEGNAQADQARKEADAYAKDTRSEADAYAKETRKTADADAAEVRAEADADAQDTIADAQAQARRIVDEGTRRREDIEAVIADLVRRRDEVLDDTEELGGKLSAAVGEHRPLQGSDPFDLPSELDPAAREADTADEPAEDEPFDAAEELEPEELLAQDAAVEAEEDLEPETGEEDAEPEPEPEPEAEAEEKPKPKRRRTRKVSS
jgi:V/A-type H+-transporting ATPase subunit G/H